MPDRGGMLFTVLVEPCLSLGLILCAEGRRLEEGLTLLEREWGFPDDFEADGDAPTERNELTIADLDRRWRSGLESSSLFEPLCATGK
jgi:hypothetical protein